MGERRCSSCGMAIQDYHKNCPYCKTKQGAPDESLSSNFACPHCKQIVNPTDTKCSHCGKELGYDLIVIGTEEENYNIETYSDESVSEDNEYVVSSPKQLFYEQQLDELVKRSRRIDDKLTLISQYLKFFVIIVAIAIAVYIISLFVSCSAACKAADELNSLYSFFHCI